MSSLSHLGQRDTYVLQAFPVSLGILTYLDPLPADHLSTFTGGHKRNDYVPKTVPGLPGRRSTLNDRPFMGESNAPEGAQIASIGGRPVGGQRPPPLTVSDFRLLGDFKSIVDLDTQVPHGRLQLGVAEQKLHGSEVRMRPVNPS